MSKPLRRSSGWIAASALTILALALVGSARAPASTSILPPGAIAPTDAQRATARKIGRILEEAHYTPRADRRQDVGARVHALPRLPRRPAQLFSGERHHRIRRLPPEVRRHDPHRRHRAGVPDLQSLPTTQPRAYGRGNRAAEGRARLDRERVVRVRPCQGALAGDRRRDERPVAQAREERCAVADADGQTVA